MVPRMTPSDYMDAPSDEITALLRELVRIPTVNPSGENRAAITAPPVRETTARGLKTRRLTAPRALLKKTRPPARCCPHAAARAAPSLERPGPRPRPRRGNLPRGGHPRAGARTGFAREHPRADAGGI
ncbi:MAG: hypothetical protein LBI02_05425 [Opitutaceae bacterium]|nr:hypothetical protein [Opitutaceae bacterium]